MKISFNKLPLFLSLIFTLLYIPHASANNPSIVYQAANNIEQNIQEIRRHQNITSSPREPDIQIAKTPIHAFTKALEVFEKVARYKKIQNLSITEVATLPNKKVTPADVYDTTNNTIAELTRIDIPLSLPPVKNMPLVDIKITPNEVFVEFKHI